MCRVLAYVGPGVLVDHLLFKPKNSLVRQAYEPKLSAVLNLAGFGMVAWDRDSRDPDVPFSHRSLELPFFDRNLKALGEKVAASTLIAHIRGVLHDPGSTISESNLHPFLYPGFKLAFAHNGDLADFGKYRFDLARHVVPEVAKHIRGNTDSEWMYALVLSQLEDPTGRHSPEELVDATERALRIIRQVRDAHAVQSASPVNLFMTEGDDLVVIRFVFDYGWYATHDPFVHEVHVKYKSLMFTHGTSFGNPRPGQWGMVGDKDAIDAVLLSSEPLSRDSSAWAEVPEYHAMVVARRNGRPFIATREIDA